ncbi:unnamed protein product, partial [Brassica rapa subsp. trilocularis]
EDSAPAIPAGTSPVNAQINIEDSIEASVAMDLEPDGSLITPPSSPYHPDSNHPTSTCSSPSGSPIPFALLPSENLSLPTSKITHLLALPAYHHPIPVKTNSIQKANPKTAPPESKFLLSPNPFACLAKDPVPPSDSDFLTLSSSTLPDVGSLLPAGEKSTF